jgi:RsiW-degrading membrane proteinase PrsW (M82 family)
MHNTELSIIAVVALCALLAFIPVFVWGHLFLKKHPEAKKLVVLTFIGGAVSVIPLLIYKFSWQFFPWINAFVWTRNINVDVLGFSSIMLIPVPIIVTFMLVGVIEEISKIFVVKVLDQDRLKSIDDAIELSIIAALGFAFVENIIYFYNIISVQGFEQLITPFIFRSVFSTFAHVMFSGIFGYYYGLAHFAEPILKEEIQKNRHPLINFFHKYFHIKRFYLFQDEKILEGLVLASSLHALFNIFLEMKWTFLIIPFLFMGYMILNYLLKKKENLKVYGKLAPERTSK